MDTREHGGADAIYDAHARIAARGCIAADARWLRQECSMISRLAAVTINGWIQILLRRRQWQS